jgi:hypothetical protein
VNRTYDEHLEDGALMRVIDEGSAADTHLTNCRRCAERLETLRRRSGRLAALLGSTDESGRALPAAAHRRRPRRRSPAMGIAAVLALLIATAAVPPVRALLIDGLRRVLPAPTVAPSETGTEAASAPPPDSSAVVSFAVSGATFQLSVEYAQPHGAVTIVRGMGDLASASISASAGRESFVVRSDGLRILNSAASTTGYRITLPNTVDEIVITLPNRNATRLASPITDSLVVPLNTRG